MAERDDPTISPNDEGLDGIDRHGGVWRPIVGDDLRELYDVLRRAFDALAGFHGRLPAGLSALSAFAVGEALGVLSKAKSQVGRDIDEREEAQR
jgi:hypothetical protein